MPPFLGIKILKNIDLNSIVPIIDWKMYFSAWDLRPSLNTDVHNNLKNDSEKLLNEIIEKKILGAAAVVGFFEVTRTGDSLVLGEQKLHFLRQQNGDICLSLADFFNPKEKDYIGLFACTAGLGAEAAAKKFSDNNDDYSALMLKLLADRMAEALTEKLYRELLNGVGIRAAPGYPASPDHTEKATIWKILEPEKNIGLELTENFVMNPAASECGYFVMHPKSCYFKVGKIGEDQLADYAKRKNMSVEFLRKWIV